MYIKITTKVLPLLATRQSVFTALVRAVQGGYRLSYRKLLAQCDFESVGGVFKFIRRCKALGLKTNVI